MNKWGRKGAGVGVGIWDIFLVEEDGTVDCKALKDIKKSSAIHIYGFICYIDY